MNSFRVIKYISGKKANIYSVILDNNLNDEFNIFLNQYLNDYEQEILSLVDRIDKIANLTGVREHFLKDEGLEAVYRFYNDDPESKLRLYCIKWGNELIIGNGGTKDVRTWQEDQKLTAIVRGLAKIDKYLFEEGINLDEASKHNTIFEIG